MRTDANGHAVISWATIALFLGIAGTFLSGVIQIGSLTTTVQINSKRVDDLEKRERDRVVEHLNEAISAGTVKSAQDHMNLTIQAIELHDIQTREREGLIQERIAKAEATASAAAGAITTAVTAAANAAAAAAAAAASSNK